MKLTERSPSSTLLSQRQCSDTTIPAQRWSRVVMTRRTASLYLDAASIRLAPANQALVRRTPPKDSLPIPSRKAIARFSKLSQANRLLSMTPERVLPGLSLIKGELWYLQNSVHCFSRRVEPVHGTLASASARQYRQFAGSPHQSMILSTYGDLITRICSTSTAICTVPLQLDGKRETVICVEIPDSLFRAEVCTQSRPQMTSFCALRPKQMDLCPSLQSLRVG